MSSITRLTLGIMALFVLPEVFGQDTKFNAVEQINSGLGMVHFVEGDSAKGQVAYLNSLKIEFDGKARTPKSVESFYIYNRSNSRKHFFVALEYDDKRTGVNDFYFFEILFEFKSFALLRKTDQKEIYEAPSPALGSSADRQAYATYEGIYVFDKDGNTEPFLETRFLERDPAKNRVTTKIVSDKLLFSHLEPHLPALKKFAKTNKLSFDDKNDFLKIMEYYKDLTK